MKRGQYRPIASILVQGAPVGGRGRRDQSVELPASSRGVQMRRIGAEWQAVRTRVAGIW
jgi:hypothetical protein